MVVQVEVINGLTDRAAPMPELVFGANLSEDGTTVLPGARTVEQSTFRGVETFPRHPDSDCLLTAGFPSRGLTIDADDSLFVLVTLGGIPDPVPDDIALLVRLFLEDGDRVDLAPIQLSAPT